MSTTNDGGPAFPVDNVQNWGMTLRDYFAGQALAGWLASYGDTARHPVEDGAENKVSEISYRMADAMLAERTKL